jgi:outer membrane protein TolC
VKRPIAFLIILFLGLFSRSVLAEDVLTWDDCIREAAKNHPDLIAAVEVVNQSKAVKKITASTLFPQINSSVNAATAKTTTSDSGDKTSQTQDVYSYGVSGSQLIFDGFKTINNVKAASENIKASQQNYRFTSSTVRFRLRSAFIDLLKAQELILVARDITKIRRDNLVLITLRYQSGQEHRGALLNAEANLAEAKFEMDQAKRALEVAEQELNKELGRQTFASVQVKGDFQVSDSVKEKPDFEVLVQNNPSLQQLIAQKNAAAFSVKAAQGSFFPTLSALGNAARASSHWPPGNDQWDLGLGLSLPIFEGGLRVAQVSQAKAILNQTVANERSARDGVILSLEQTWAVLQNAIDNVGVQEKFLIATEERAKIAEAQYSIGTITYDNWTIIEDDLVNAKKTFLNAQANALVSEASWILAKGETLEHEK